MPKKTAIAVASAVMGIVLVASTAVALNLGILSRTAPTVAAEEQTLAFKEAPSPSPVPTTDDEFTLFPDGVKVITVYVDEPTPAVPELAPEAVPVAPAAVAPPPPSAPPPPPTQQPKKKKSKKPEPLPPTPGPTLTPLPTPKGPERPTPAAVTGPQDPPAAPSATPVPAQTPGPTITYPTYSVGSAGDVALQFDGSSIAFWGAYPNSGWQYVVEKSGPTKVKVKFRPAQGGDELEFQAELNGNRIKVEVDD